MTTSAGLAQAERAWHELQTIPLDEQHRIRQDFGGFPAGTPWHTIMDWFESAFDLSVAQQLMH